MGRERTHGRVRVLERSQVQLGREAWKCQCLAMAQVHTKQTYQRA
jgi:hypothetical protein